MTYARRIKKWIMREKLLITASLIFVAFQFAITFILWDRKGDLPPGYADSLVYILGINKVIKYHTLFPYFPTIGFSEHFTYIGYNLFMGVLGMLTGMSGDKIFYYSFFFGKVVLLFSLIYLLRNIFKTEKLLMILSLFFLSFYFGNGDTHGFFWVVPSFWMVLVFFLLVGIILDNKNFSNLLLFLLSFFYITLHPISSYSVIIFIFFTAALYFFDKEIFKRSVKVTVFLCASVLIFQSVIFISSNYSTLFYKNAQIVPVSSLQKAVESRNINVISLSTLVSKSVRISDKKTVDQGITNSIPSISFSLFKNQIEGSVNYISGYFPSIDRAWSSYFGWFYRIPVLLLVLAFSFYSNFKNKRYYILALYFSCLLFSLISLINQFGERSIIFLFPITIILISAGIYDLYFLTRKLSDKTKLKFLKSIIILSIAIGAIGFAWFGIVSANYYSRQADYKTDTSKCEDFIKAQDKNKTDIFFYSNEGIAYFQWKNFENYKLFGINYYSPTNQSANDILIIENMNVMDQKDIGMPLIRDNKLQEIINENEDDFNTKIDCGIFKLYGNKRQ